MAIHAKLNALALDNTALWVAEAQFGFAQVNETISALPDGASVLEVGCGSGILLAMLAEAYPRLVFFGMEPFGEGFAALKDLNALVRETGVEIDNCGYETYENSKKHDVIFCVNVFEHVQDWQDFLSWSSSKLKSNGTFIVLCPNYSFPFESHFKIPILLTKRITGSVFHRYITQFEKRYKAEGLWLSLNFVKKRDVRRFVARTPALGLSLRDELSVIDDMVARLGADAEFRERQTILGRAALRMKGMGVFGVIKAFPDFVPYMKLSFQKAGQGGKPI